MESYLHHDIGMASLQILVHALQLAEAVTFQKETLQIEIITVYFSLAPARGARRASRPTEPCLSFIMVVVLV